MGLPQVLHFKSGEEKMTSNCETDLTCGHKKMCVEWVRLSQNAYKRFRKHTKIHTQTHTTNYPNKREQKHTHTPSPIRVNEQTQTCTTVHAHKLILAHTHTPVHPPRACAHTKKRNYIENNEPPLNSHNVVDVQQFNERNMVPETSQRLLLIQETFKSHDECID